MSEHDSKESLRIRAEFLVLYLEGCIDREF